VLWHICRPVRYVNCEIIHFKSYKLHSDTNSYSCLHHFCMPPLLISYQLLVKISGNTIPTYFLHEVPFMNERTKDLLFHFWSVEYRVELLLVQNNCHHTFTNIRESISISYGYVIGAKTHLESRPYGTTQCTGTPHSTPVHHYMRDDTESFLYAEVRWSWSILRRIWPVGGTARFATFQRKYKATLSS
jgi:hypothetical protein